MPSGVTLTEMTDSHTMLVLAGPRARELLAALSPRNDWSHAAFPPMQVRRMHLGHARVVAMRVSFSGELAYELHVPNGQLLPVYRLLMRAGREFGLVQFGLYAADSSGWTRATSSAARPLRRRSDAETAGGSW